MKDILGIYIIDENRNPIFLYEIFKKESSEMEYALLANFISAFENFTDELGGLNKRSVDLGNTILFWDEDNITNTIFILRCVKNAKEKRMLGHLKKIKNAFIDIFTGHLQDSKEVKINLTRVLERKIRDMFEKESDIAKFLREI